MSMNHSAHDYQRALTKLRAEPLTLTEADFAAMAEFNPADEVRARDLVRTKQLDLVNLHTKSLPRTTPAEEVADKMADVVESCIKAALQPLVQRLRVQKAEIATLQQQVRALAQNPEHPDDPDDRALFDVAH